MRVAEIRQRWKYHNEGEKNTEVCKRENDHIRIVAKIPGRTVVVGLVKTNAAAMIHVLQHRSDQPGTNHAQPYQHYFRRARDHRRR